MPMTQFLVYQKHYIMIQNIFTAKIKKLIQTKFLHISLRQFFSPPAQKCFFLAHKSHSNFIAHLSQKEGRMRRNTQKSNRSSSSTQIFPYFFVSHRFFFVLAKDRNRRNERGLKWPFSIKIGRASCLRGQKRKKGQRRRKSCQTKVGELKCGR